MASSKEILAVREFFLHPPKIVFKGNFSWPPKRVSPLLGTSGQVKTEIWASWYLVAGQNQNLGSTSPSNCKIWAALPLEIAESDPKNPQKFSRINPKNPPKIRRGSPSQTQKKIPKKIHRRTTKAQSTSGRKRGESNTWKEERRSIFKKIKKHPPMASTDANEEDSGFDYQGGFPCNVERVVLT